MGNEFITNMSYKELKDSCPDKDEVENIFQSALSNNNRDQMWFCVWKTCHNIAKSIYKQRNIIVTDNKLLDITTDACCYCMSFILGYNKKYPNGIRPNKLSSYCYFRVLKMIQDPKDVWYEKNVLPILEDKYKDIDMEIAENA